MNDSEQPQQGLRVDQPESVALVGQDRISKSLDLKSNSVAFCLPAILLRREAIVFAGFVVVPLAIASIPYLAGSEWIIGAPVLGIMPMSSAMVRTIAVMTVTWQLIGAALYCRERGTLGKVLIICVFELPVFLFQQLAFLIIMLINMCAHS